MSKYLNEATKGIRYDKIKDAIEKRIHELADEYISENGNKRIEDDHGKCREYILSEEQLDDEAYAEACQKYMDSVEEHFGSGEIYWIFEIILSEDFGYEPSLRNPYAVRQKAMTPTINKQITPMEMMFNIMNGGNQ